MLPHPRPCSPHLHEGQYQLQNRNVHRLERDHFGDQRRFRTHVRRESAIIYKISKRDQIKVAKAQKAPQASV